MIEITDNFLNIIVITNTKGLYGFKTEHFAPITERKLGISLLKITAKSKTTGRTYVQSYKISNSSINKYFQNSDGKVMISTPYKTVERFIHGIKTKYGDKVFYYKVR